MGRRAARACLPVFPLACLPAFPLACLPAFPLACLRAYPLAWPPVASLTAACPLACLLVTRLQLPHLLVPPRPSSAATRLLP